ncbi:hypothetical protein SLS58_004496 [Diplodia intermedia]|uniref:DUF6590 domain-containing protein n=1 Tax=Diplodia intermedia TaxID=856260 RepID=A0ABR3TTI8_9PEZI
MSDRYSSPGVRSNASSQSSRNYQSLDPRDWRGFFVPGRIFMYQLHPDELDYNGKKQRLSVPKASSKPLCIKTYEGEGCTHREVRSKQDRHAVVYTSDEPSRLREETNLRAPIQADPISHETVIPRLARLNYDSLFDFAHARPIYPLAQVTPRGLQTLLRDFEELNPPTIRPVTRKRTWDRMVDVLDATHLDATTTTNAAIAIAAPSHQRAPAVRPIRPTRRTSTFPPPIPEAPPTTTTLAPRIQIVAPRTTTAATTGAAEPEEDEAQLLPAPATKKKRQQAAVTTTTTTTTPFPQRHSPRAAPIPILLSSARDPRATAPVRALFDTACELNFVDPELALSRLGATALRWNNAATADEQQQPTVVMPGSGSGNGAVVVVPPAAEGMVKLRWRFQGAERSDVDTFVVFRGLPYERRRLEESDRHKSESRKRKEARENEEIERKFARERAALWGR